MANPSKPVYRSALSQSLGPFSILLIYDAGTNRIQDVSREKPWTSQHCSERGGLLGLPCACKHAGCGVPQSPNREGRHGPANRHCGERVGAASEPGRHPGLRLTPPTTSIFFITIFAQVVTEQIKRAAPHVSVEVVNIAEITSDALDKVPDIEASVRVGVKAVADVKDFVFLIGDLFFVLPSSSFASSWVEVGCPRLAIDWGESFSKPILTPFEALSLFGTPCFPSSPPSSSESPAAEHLPIPPCGGSVMHYLPTDTLCPCAGSDVVHPMDQWRPATERPWLHSGAERALKLKADYSEHCAQNAPTLMNDAQAVKAPSSAVSIPAVIVAI